jgi:hypothetical protein
MTKNMRLLPVITFLAMVVFMFSGTSQSTASSDNLKLGGYIKSVNSLEKTVTVDVRSTACKGEKRFKVADSRILGSIESQIGHWIAFYIESNNCKGDAVNNMSKLIVIKKKRSTGK